MMTNLKVKLRKHSWGFTGSSVVGNPPASAGDAGLSPGPGGFHMLRSNWDRAPQLLSLRSRDCEPQLLRPMHLDPVLSNKERPREREAHTLQQGVAPAHCSEEPTQPKINKQINKSIKKKEKKKLPFTIATKRIKYLGINLP